MSEWNSMEDFDADDLLASIGEIPVDSSDLNNIYVDQVTTIDKEQIDNCSSKSRKEINYERKKSRAKISRQEVNSKFSELIELLNVPTTRRSNRAGVINEAIIRIRSLQTQLVSRQIELSQAQRRILELLKNDKSGSQKTRKTDHTHQISSSSGASSDSSDSDKFWSQESKDNIPSCSQICGPVTYMCVPEYAPFQYQNSGLNQFQSPTIGAAQTMAMNNRSWICPSPSSINHPTLQRSQMLWMPVQAVSHTATPINLLQSNTKQRNRKHKKPRKKRMERLQNLLHQVLEHGNMLSFLDAVSLCKSRQVSRLWRAYSSQDRFWNDLTIRRWNLSSDYMDSMHNSSRKLYIKYVKFHKSLQMPSSIHCKDTLTAACGRSIGIDVWCQLGHRSNCRTTRSVWLGNGQGLQAIEVVELRVLVQNTWIKDGITLNAAAISVKMLDHSNTEVIGCNSNTAQSTVHYQLLPRVIEKNGKSCKDFAIDDFVLYPLDYGTFSFYVMCPGKQFESDFLLSAKNLKVEVRHNGTSNSSTLFMPFVEKNVVESHYERDSGGLTVKRRKLSG